MAHTQFLWKPGGIETDSNHTHFRIMTRSAGWPDGLAQPESLTNDLTDVQEDMVGESHNLIIPRHFQTWLNCGGMETHAGGLKDEGKNAGGNDIAKVGEEGKGGSLFGSNLLF